MSTVPMFPDAARPSTNPCAGGGYARLAIGSATEKLAPATPRQTEKTRASPYPVTPNQPQHNTSSSAKRMASAVDRAPNQSALHPPTIRNTAPPSNGKDTSQAIS